VAFYDRLVLFFGVDLAWNEAKPKETGLVVLDESGRVRAADWRLGIAAAADWIEEHAEDETLVFIDAPLVVTNPAGTQRTCEWHVGKCYGSAKVSANSTHIEKERLGGVTLRKELERSAFVTTTDSTARRKRAGWSASATRTRRSSALRSSTTTCGRATNEGRKTCQSESSARSAPENVTS
jgi:predicted RNase H-like nuclease